MLFPCGKCCGGSCTCTPCLQMNVSGSDSAVAPCSAFNSELVGDIRGERSDSLSIDGKPYQCVYRFPLDASQSCFGEIPPLCGSSIGYAYLVMPRKVEPPDPSGNTPSSNGKARLLVRVVHGAGWWSTDYERELQECPRWVQPGDPGSVVADEGYEIIFTEADIVASKGTNVCRSARFVISECHERPPVCCCVDTTQSGGTPNTFIFWTQAGGCAPVGTVVSRDKCRRLKDFCIGGRWCGIDNSCPSGTQTAASPDWQCNGTPMNVFGEENTAVVVKNPRVSLTFATFGIATDRFCDGYVIRAFAQTLSQATIYRASDLMYVTEAIPFLKTYIVEHDTRTGRTTITLDAVNSTTTPNSCGAVNHYVCTDDPEVEIVPEWEFIKPP